MTPAHLLMIASLLLLHSDEHPSYSLPFSLRPWLTQRLDYSHPNALSATCDLLLAACCCPLAQDENPTPSAGSSSELLRVTPSSLFFLNSSPTLQNSCQLSFSMRFQALGENIENRKLDPCLAYIRCSLRAPWIQQVGSHLFYGAQI